MILNVSGRTDIVAFYTEWFMNRYHEGFIDVRNPFNPKLISRISFDNVDLIVFCTKNPIPIMPHLKMINIPILFHITLTPYHKDIEPNVINKSLLIEKIKELSLLVGKDRLTIRYDPIFINDKYNIEYHIKAFKRLCSLLNGYVNRILISFIDSYKNVNKHLNELNYKELNDFDYKEIGVNFSKIARDNNINIFTCCEEENLIEYGFIKNDCVPIKQVYEITGKLFPKWKARNSDNCNCCQMVDIGVYNTCKHYCKYCYANYNEDDICNNMKLHDPKSSLLIGHINEDDIIKERFK